MGKTNLGRVALVPCGKYDNSTEYKRLDIVENDGSSYIFLKDSIGVAPVGDNIVTMLIAGKGGKGDAFTFDDFTPEQLAVLKGDKGDPGASFRVAGEYETLQALQAAVPDGSAVDGFMAVGAKVPYEYYAWVNGAWKDQGQIAGGAGKMVIIPNTVLSLTSQSTSNEILNAFGDKDTFVETALKIKDGAPASVKVSDSNVVLFKAGATADEATGTYTLLFVYINPLTSEEGQSYTFNLTNSVATLVKAGTGFGLVDIANSVMRKRLIPIHFDGDKRGVLLLWEDHIGYSENHYAVGDILFEGSTNEPPTIVHIKVGSYQEDEYTYFSSSIVDGVGQIDWAKFCRCKYNGKWYAALNIGEGGFLGSYPYFIGSYDVEPIFNWIPYYDLASDTVLNEEIYSHILNNSSTFINRPQNILYVTSWLQGTKTQLTNEEYSYFSNWKNQNCPIAYDNGTYLMCRIEGERIYGYRLYGGEANGNFSIQGFAVYVNPRSPYNISIEENSNGYVFFRLDGVENQVLNAQGEWKKFVQSDDVAKAEKLTQTQYDALSTKDSSTLYIIID